MIYAGIGSRNIPKWVYDFMIKLGSHFAIKGYTLRSGGANGSDVAFEKGCDKQKGNKEIYLPWVRFNDSNSELVVSNKIAFDIAEKYHPYWNNLKQGGKKLQARNSHQILGWNLISPCDFVVCYTKNGNGSGGTGQAIRIASAHNIPIFDIGNYKNEEEAIASMKKFFQDMKK